MEAIYFIINLQTCDIADVFIQLPPVEGRQEWYIPAAPADERVVHHKQETLLHLSWKACVCASAMNLTLRQCCSVHLTGLSIADIRKHT